MGVREMRGNNGVQTWKTRDVGARQPKSRATKVIHLTKQRGQKLGREWE